MRSSLYRRLLIFFYAFEETASKLGGLFQRTNLYKLWNVRRSTLCENKNQGSVESNSITAFPLGFWRSRVRRGGLEEIRTPDLIIANDALYQLSYEPKT